MLRALRAVLAELKAATMGSVRARLDEYSLAWIDARVRSGRLPGNEAQQLLELLADKLGAKLEITEPP